MRQQDHLTLDGRQSVQDNLERNPCFHRKHAFDASLQQSRGKGTTAVNTQCNLPLWAAKHLCS